MEVDEAMHSLGRWSRWHLAFFLLLGISDTFPAAWHMMAIVFLGELLVTSSPLGGYLSWYGHPYRRYGQLFRS